MVTKRWYKIIYETNDHKRVGKKNKFLAPTARFSKSKILANICALVLDYRMGLMPDIREIE